MLTLISSVFVTVLTAPESKCLMAVNVRTVGAELQMNMKTSNISNSHCVHMRKENLGVSVAVH